FYCSLLYVTARKLPPFHTRRSSDPPSAGPASPRGSWARTAQAGGGGARYCRRGGAPRSWAANITHGPREGSSGAFTPRAMGYVRDRKSTRLNSSHVKISYAVFCLKK